MADGYTVLRDGRTVGSGDVAEVDQIPSLIAMMVGRRALDELYPARERSVGEPLLAARAWRVTTPLPKHVSFDLRPRRDTRHRRNWWARGAPELRRIFGLDAARAGTLSRADGGRSASTISPGRAWRGAGHPERGPQGRGPRPGLSVADNLTLSRLEGLGRGGWCSLVGSAPRRVGGSSGCPSSAAARRSA